MNTSFDRVTTLTLQNHGKEIFDNITTNNALLYMLKNRENIKVVSGGRKFTHPLYYKINTSFKSYAKLETIDTPQMEDITRAEYDIKIVAGSLVISTFEEAQNAGDKEKLLGLADEVRLGAELSMSEVLGDQVWADGSSPNDFDGLAQLVSTTPTAVADVGGIAQATYSYWQNYVNTTGTATFNTTQAGLKLMNTALNSTTFGSKGPRCVITTKAVYALYEIGLANNIRYATTELADAGFLHLAYTTMPVLFDDNCPAGRMYFVNQFSLN